MSMGGVCLPASVPPGETLPLAFWRLAGKNRRRYGGYIIHMGVVLMAIGIIGIEVFQTETQGTISQGQSISLDQYTVTYRSLAEFNTPDGRNVARAVVDVQKNGKPMGQLFPRRDYYYDAQQTDEYSRCAQHHGG